MISLSAARVVQGVDVESSGTQFLNKITTSQRSALQDVASRRFTDAAFGQCLTIKVDKA